MSLLILSKYKSFICMALKPMRKSLCVLSLDLRPVCSRFWPGLQGLPCAQVLRLELC